MNVPVPVVSPTATVIVAPFDSVSTKGVSTGALVRVAVIVAVPPSSTVRSLKTTAASSSMIVTIAKPFAGLIVALTASVRTIRNVSPASIVSGPSSSLSLTMRIGTENWVSPAGIVIVPESGPSKKSVGFAADSATIW